MIRTVTIRRVLVPEPGIEPAKLILDSTEYITGATEYTASPESHGLPVLGVWVVNDPAMNAEAIHDA